MASGLVNIQFGIAFLLTQVRGVGAGGIVSSAYCLLYKLYTLRLTRKQLNGLLTHTDSPYIRALGRLNGWLEENKGF